MSDPDVLRQLQLLRRQLEEAEQWSEGVFLALEMVLPHLLRGHPSVAAVGAQLRAMAERYEALHADPGRAVDPADTPGRYEPAKMLYRQLDLLHVWPPQDAAPAKD